MTPAVIKEGPPGGIGHVIFFARRYLRFLSRRSTLTIYAYISDVETKLRSKRKKFKKQIANGDQTAQCSGCSVTELEDKQSYRYLWLSKNCLKQTNGW